MMITDSKSFGWRFYNLGTPICIIMFIKMKNNGKTGGKTVECATFNIIQGCVSQQHGHDVIFDVIFWISLFGLVYECGKNRFMKRSK